MEDNKPKGGGAKRRPLGAGPKALPCCLPFGKDFLCFCFISGAHSGSILALPRYFFWGGLFLVPRATFGQHLGNFLATLGQLWGNFEVTLGQFSRNFRHFFSIDGFRTLQVRN